MMSSNPMLDVLMETAAMRRGILPIRPCTIDRDYGKDTAQMSPEDSRRARRKFRKAWRAAAKRSEAESMAAKGTGRYARRTLGLGAPAPSRAQKRARKIAVLNLMRGEASSAMGALMPTE